MGRRHVLVPSVSAQDVSALLAHRHGFRAMLGPRVWGSCRGVARYVDCQGSSFMKPWTLQTSPSRVVPRLSSASATYIQELALTRNREDRALELHESP